MAKKPTAASVTTKPCKCGYLDRQSKEPASGVEFDSSVNEYNIKGTGRRSVIYHCPWCGGAAPLSRRESLFETITRDELLRLQKLVEDIKTVDQAVAAFGQPDRDVQNETGIGTPENGKTPATFTRYRTLTFSKLSKTADVQLMDCSPAAVRFSFVTKIKNRNEV